MISCILLSAGVSSRFGSPKALAKINTQTVIEYLLSNLIESNINDIAVVLGAQAEEIKTHVLDHKKVKVVYNKNYNLGQTSSFKVGLEAIKSRCSGIMLLPVDYPLIKRATFNVLIDHFMVKTPTILIPTYQQKKGHPPIFAAALRQSFLDMDYSVGVNSVEHEYVSDTLLLPIDDPGVIGSFNTPEEFNEILKNYR